MSRQLLIGALTDTSTTPDFTVGAVYESADGDVYRYLKNNSGAALVATHPYIYNESHEVKLIANTGNITNGDSVACGIAVSAIADGSYGWVFIGPGQVSGYAKGAITAQKIVYVTADAAGTFDDAVVAGMKVYGLTAPTAITGAGSASFVAASGLFISA